MLSRFLGLARDIVFAALFGTGGAQDAFMVAFKVPNFLRRLFAEGAFNQAFIPVLSEYKQAEGDDSVQKLVAAVQIYLGGVVGLVTLLAMVGSPVVAWLFAAGYHDEPEKLALVSDFLKLTFPYLWFISLTALGSSVLNSYGHFTAPALAPVLLNICLIGSALVLSPLFEVPQTGVGMGVILAGLAQLLFIMPALYKTGVWKPFSWHRQHPGVKKIQLLMLPALFGVSVSQINLLLDTVLATFLQDASVSWLYYSDRLMELPLGIFGIAIATVLLPSLSSLRGEHDTGKFTSTLAWAMVLVLMLGLPAAAALFVLPNELLTLLFQVGKFTVEDVAQSASSLMAYALGLPAFMLIKVLAPAFFARQDTKTPVKVGIQAMVWNMVFNLLLFYPLGHVGLALATSLSAWLNAALLAKHLKSLGQLPSRSLLLKPIAKVVVATMVMSAVLLLVLRLPMFIMSDAILGRMGVVASLIAMGGGSYFVALYLLGVRVKHLRHA
ncbi:murein biosynthesis integral membrane protein MurJ [Reinekea forsetii]|nr:murein biosynthesis integral membrane protein MurJ [Reinekea forsetii]